MEMRIYYYKCKKCGKEVHIAKRIHHLIKEHGFKDEDFPYTKGKGYLKPEWAKLLEAENKLLIEWFGEKPSRTKQWVSPRKAWREL
jgi:hypothetical protein